MSQMGAFITTEDWSVFQVNDKATVTYYLLPDCTGQNEIIGLQGEATIRRLDPVTKCVAVEYVKSFKQFERVKLLAGFTTR